jgi:Ca-activated chloride channel family protein
MLQATGASRVRTSLVLGAASATVIAALLLTQGTPAARPEGFDSSADDGMSIVAELTTSKILAGAHDENVAITIKAPKGRAAYRPPLSVAVVIDRSGSMSGAPMENAKAAASRLIGQLDGNDAFTVIAYSSGDQVVMPMSRASDQNKSAARAAIERIYDDGGTCISCGLVRGASELERSPIGDGVRRIVLISDGQANEGIWDRDELAQLAQTTAARGTSISAVGVGLDFDEVTMQRIASVGRGNYYFVEDTANLSAMFAKELGGLAETVASDVRLVVDGGEGVMIEEAYGYQMSRHGDSVIIPIADLRAGETRKVVLRVRVATSQLVASKVITSVHMGWRRVADGAQRNAKTAAIAEIVDDSRAVAASVIPRAAQAVEEALSARALEEAAIVYEAQGYEAAKQVLDVRMDQVNRNTNLTPTTRARIESSSTRAMENFKSAPKGKAMKMSREDAYNLSR